MKINRFKIIVNQNGEISFQKMSRYNKYAIISLEMLPGNTITCSKFSLERKTF